MGCDAPGCQADAGAGDEHQRITLAVKLVVEVNVVDFNFAAFDRFQLLHGFLALPYAASPTVTLSNTKNTVNHFECRLEAFMRSVSPVHKRLGRAARRCDGPCR